MTDKLNHRVGHGEDVQDLHHKLCNEDYFIIGTYKAKQFLGEHAFDAIGIIKEYEENAFGECNTDFSSPEKVANMLAYIIGEYVLCFSNHFQGILFDVDGSEKLTKEDIHKIIDIELAHVYQRISDLGYQLKLTKALHLQMQKKKFK